MKKPEIILLSLTIEGSANQFQGIRNTTLHSHTFGECLAEHYKNVFYVPLRFVFSLWQIFNKESVLWFVAPVEESAFNNFLLEHIKSNRQMRMVLLEDKPQYSYDLFDFVDAVVPLTRNAAKVYKSANKLPVWEDVRCPLPLEYLFGLQETIEVNSGKTATLFHNISLDCDSLISLEILANKNYTTYGAPNRIDQLGEIKEKTDKLKTEIYTNVQHFGLAKSVDLCFQANIHREYTMGRIAAMAAAAGKVSVAGNYCYQELLFPETTVKDGNYLKAIEFAEENHEQIVDEASKRIHDLGYDVMGKRIVNHIERM